MNKSTPILLVDDAITTRRLTRTYLTQVGLANLTESDDGINAWPLIIEAAEKSEPFGLIICDWNMPKMNGLELLQKIRAEEKISKTPFLIITGETEQKNIIAAMKYGVSGYILKPFTQAILVEKVSRILSDTKN